ncbi:hypothetical protein GTZ99_07930 [Novosphingobium sp. FSY-8]|uniref:Short chain dehydrogenase-like proteobacteria domain-containing protein n=1 Tax=Novosphingobium ovatum TaxID=1908523 RepID=A0ABW9XDD1_9SPHN|nr:hypothetical protein [Novosphingobium ovatum]NBC36482.1 hypothetical protein [Novosphingobium ovatum]
MTQVRIEDLPEDPLGAAAHFHSVVAPALVGVSRHLPRDLMLVLPPADHTHRAWRLAAIQALARELAPQRVNAVESDDTAAIAAAHAWLEAAPGITGQVFPLDGQGAGPVIA